jgi:hypothetical protein
VRYALDFHEFYKPAGDVPKARALLEEAARRLASLQSGQTPWRQATGLTVRGYYSPIDGSPQPYGLDIPDDAPKKNAPAWVWLRGRADTGTDLHFIAERLKKPGQFRPPGTIVIHPFGRYCVGYKNAGEQDVLHVVERLGRSGLIDPTRVALAGFSMGGAGAWLLGAHAPDQWAVIHAGAGFVDVRRYQNLSAAAIQALPPWERTLWQQNDVPSYVRNLLDIPLISYSGENDKQRASATIMAEELLAHGRTLTQFIGPGVAHKYHPETAREVERAVQSPLLETRPPYPLSVHIQTPTLDYASHYWVHLMRLHEHWQEARVDAQIDAAIPAATMATLTTQNVVSLRLTSPREETFRPGFKIVIDGQSLASTGGKTLFLTRDPSGAWNQGPTGPPAGLVKKPNLQGPIDDAFTGPFLYVLPDYPCADPQAEAWVQHEITYQRDRWRALMRGDLRAKKASAVSADDLKNFHLILWGDAKANALIAQVLPKLPLPWEPGARILSLIYPNPLQPERYVVLNSGLTFRESHSKTNSLQNPKLPDWAIVDATRVGDDYSPGQVLRAGFFNETWQLSKEAK